MMGQGEFLETQTMFNPFTLAAKAMYLPFRAAIRATWNAAVADEGAAIVAELEQFGESVEDALAEMRPQAIESPKPRKK